jgi:hypothetical protein
MWLMVPRGDHPLARRTMPANKVKILHRCSRATRCHLVSRAVSAFGGILLQKSKVARRLTYREITKREAIADSYSLTHISEVACEFNVRR